MTAVLAPGGTFAVMTAWRPPRSVDRRVGPRQRSAFIAERPAGSRGLDDERRWDDIESALGAYPTPATRGMPTPRRDCTDRSGGSDGLDSPREIGIHISVNLVVYGV
ncbi:MAG: hypothetical protein ACR2H3_09930 [Acidimicrobiales bacterium]